MSIPFDMMDDEQDDEKRPKIARPTPDATPPLALRGVSPTPAQPSALSQRTMGDETELARKQSTGSGISQIKSPFARGALRVLDTVGSVISPASMSMIPGTEMHHRMLMGQDRSHVASDIEEQGKEAQTGEATARAGLADVQTEKAKHDLALENQPKPKEEEWSIVPGMIGPNGQPVQQEKNSGQIRFAPDMQGVGPLKEPIEKTPNDFEQYYHDFLTENKFPDTAHNRLLARQQYAAAGQAPQHEPRQMAIGPDGTVIELKPGMKVPQGSKTVTGELTNKPSPDEQRRADLAENLNENLATLEEIANRRPELFGPVHGRITGLKAMVGSDDPDIGTLETIKHQIGMAQISAHGMRSAQGVAAAAESIVNSFKNGPEAVKASINAARNSVKTFSGDVERAKNPQAPQGGGKPPAVGTVEQGYRFKGGDPSDQKNWERVQ